MGWLGKEDLSLIMLQCDMDETKGFNLGSQYRSDRQSLPTILLRQKECGSGNQCLTLSLHLSSVMVQLTVAFKRLK